MTELLTGCLNVMVLLGVDIKIGLWSDGIRVIVILAVALAALPLPSEAWTVS